MAWIECHCGTRRKVDSVYDGTYWYHSGCHVCGCVPFTTTSLDYDLSITCPGAGIGDTETSDDEKEGKT